jgi:DNA (cytosine-5)-methyltransferase 1
VADSANNGHSPAEDWRDVGESEDGRGVQQSSGICSVSGLADGGGAGLARRAEQPARQERTTAERSGGVCGAGHAEDGGCGECGDAPQQGNSGHAFGAGGAGSARGADTELDGRWPDDPRRGSEGRAPHGWTRYATSLFRDGKHRRIPAEPSFFPLADGVPARVVRLRGYGNAIVPQVAAAFVTSFMEVQCHE